MIVLVLLILCAVAATAAFLQVQNAYHPQPDGIRKTEVTECCEFRAPSCFDRFRKTPFHEPATYTRKNRGRHDRGKAFYNRDEKLTAAQAAHLERTG